MLDQTPCHGAEFPKGECRECDIAPSKKTKDGATHVLNMQINGG